MDLAFCIKDEKLWDVGQLITQAHNEPEEWLDNRRQFFICPGCESKTKFVHAEKRTPHFSLVQGHKHSVDCDYREYSTPRQSGSGGPLPERGPVQGNKEIRYEKPGPLNAPVVQEGPQRGGGSANNDETDPSAAVAPLHETTKLLSLLKNLRNRPDYPPEGLRLDVPARGTSIPAADYFHKLSTVTPETPTDGVTRAFWGHISRANENGPQGKETLWINCDSRGAVVTIRVPFDVKDELYESMGITRDYELNNAHLIIEGILSQGAKKHAVSLADIEKIAFLPPRKVFA